MPFFLLPALAQPLRQFDHANVYAHTRQLVVPIGDIPLLVPVPVAFPLAANGKSQLESIGFSMAAAADIVLHEKLRFAHRRGDIV